MIKYLTKATERRKALFWYVGGGIHDGQEGVVRVALAVVAGHCEAAVPVGSRIRSRKDGFSCSIQFLRFISPDPSPWNATAHLLVFTTQLTSLEIPSSVFPGDFKIHLS